MSSAVIGKKLTETQEREVYDLKMGGETKAEVGRAYDISPRTVGRIVDRVRASLQEPEAIESAEEWEELIEEEEDFDGDLDAWLEDEDEDIYPLDIPYEAPEEEDRYEVVANDRSVTIIKNDESVTVTKGDEKFEEVSKIVWAGLGSQDSLKEAYRKASVKELLASMTHGAVTVDARNRSVSVDLGYPVEVPNRLVRRLIRMVEERDVEGVKAYAKFTEKLFLNPKPDIKDELYDFLEAADVEIDDEGRVICYKKVRSNFMDCYSGTIDNSPGERPRMKRHEVNANRQDTCSRGLHVCSKSYLGVFCGEKVIRVAIEPYDFVSIPTDYGNAKARVCEYEVMEDITENIEF